MRHPYRVFLCGHNHRQVAADTALDKADQFRLGVIVMIDVALREIDVRPEFLQSILEACGSRNRADRSDKRVPQSIERQSLAGTNILEIKRFMCAFDNFRPAIVTPDASYQIEVGLACILCNKDVAGAAKIARRFAQRASGKQEFVSEGRLSSRFLRWRY